MKAQRPLLIQPALIYLICATLWVVGGDILLLQLNLEASQLLLAQVLTGLAFVIASVALMLTFLAHSYRTQRRAEYAHRTNEERLRLALDSAQQGLWDWNLENGQIYFSERYCQMLGMTQAEFGHSRVDWEKRLHPDDLPHIQKFVDDYLQSGSQEVYHTTYRILHSQGEYRWIRARGLILQDEHDVRRFIGTALDITDRREDKERLRQLGTLFDCSHEGVLITDARSNVVYSNPSFVRITGYSLAEMLGHPPSKLQSGRHDKAFYQGMWKSINEQDAWSGEIWNRRKNGEVFPIWQSIRAVRDDEGLLTHYVAVFSDISDIKHSEQELAYLAHHDPLSDLPNRLLLGERLEQAILQAKRQQHSVALILIDLDHFKLINESFDHSVGDQLIKLLSERLRQALPSQMTLGRLGGDEFAIVVPSIDNHKNFSELPYQILDIFTEPFEVAGQTLFISASLGISLFPQDGDNFDSLLRNADSALFQAKASGRQTLSFYSEEMTAHSRHRLLMEAELRNALTQNELQVYYQPIHRLSDQQLIGVEALVRWQHPERGVISPAEFIPVAEENGLISEIDSWVLTHACAQMKRWLEQGSTLEFVAVNVSSRLFTRGDLEQRVAQTLSDNQLPARFLEIEVTESSVMNDPQAAQQILERLRAMGVQIAIDDFGTGYSSMARLKSLPLDKLKIDQSFIAGLPHEQGDVAISQAVITLGKSLGLRVLAEGIETAQQAEFLRQNGCELGQGYWFGRPLPAAQALTQRTSA